VFFRIGEVDAVSLHQFLKHSKVDEKNSSSSLEETLRDFLERKKEENQALKKLLISLNDEFEVQKTQERKNKKNAEKKQ
jgi:hypothetical protein